MTGHLLEFVGVAEGGGDVGVDFQVAKGCGVLGKGGEGTPGKVIGVAWPEEEYSLRISEVE